jgi:Fic family protein
LGTFDSSKGDLRLVGVTAGIGGRSYMNYQKVPAKLAEFCQRINERRQMLLQGADVFEQYLLSFDAHYQLVTIHPWVDGNGRMSRLVMNHLQYEFGLIPVKIVKEDKADYIQALIDSREEESLEPFREFMIEEHIQNITKEIDVFKKSQDDDPLLI